MKPLFVSSTGNFTGQTLIAWHLLRALQKSSTNPGFFKPLGYRDAITKNDPDVTLFKEVLNLPEPRESLRSALVEDVQEQSDQFEQESFLEKVKNQYDKLCQTHDRMVVLGSSDIFVKADFMGLPDGKFINLLDADVVLADRFENLSHTIYSALAITSYFGERLKAIVINQVPEDAIDALHNKLAPLKKKVGEGALALIPSDRVLGADLVSDYAKLLSGKVMANESGLDAAVEATTIGNDRLKGPLALLKRLYNKIVLLGGPHEKLADPGYQPVPVGILVTGGRLPPQAVVDICEKQGLTLVCLEMDSFAVLDRLEQNRFQVQPSHAFKVDRLAHHLEGQIDTARLIGG